MSHTEVMADIRKSLAHIQSVVEMHDDAPTGSSKDPRPTPTADRKGQVMANTKEAEECAAELKKPNSFHGMIIGHEMEC